MSVGLSNENVSYHNNAGCLKHESDGMVLMSTDELQPQNNKPLSPLNPPREKQNGEPAVPVAAYLCSHAWMMALSPNEWRFGRSPP